MLIFTILESQFVCLLLLFYTNFPRFTLEPENGVIKVDQKIHTCTHRVKKLHGTGPKPPTFHTSTYFTLSIAQNTI